MRDREMCNSLEGFDKIIYKKTFDEERTEAIRRRLSELTEADFREMDRIRQRSIEESYKITFGS